MKKLNIFFVLLLAIFCFTAVIPVSYADELDTTSTTNFFNETNNVGDDVCAEPSVKRVLKFFGTLIFILKLAVPFIIITKGTFLFYNAVIKGESKDLTKSAKEFGGKIVLGITVFFIPSLINGALGLYNDWASVKSEYTDCATCLLDPTNCTP